VGVVVALSVVGAATIIVGQAPRPGHAVDGLFRDNQHDPFGDSSGHGIPRRHSADVQLQGAEP